MPSSRCSNHFVEKQQPKFIERRPILVASSAFINDEIKENCLKAGFDQIIDVPIKYNFLIKLYNEVESKLQTISIQNDSGFS